MRRALAPLAILLGSALAFELLPSIYTNHALLFNLMVYLALAQGLNLLYGFTGYLPFGYVGFFGIGAYGASLLILRGHLPPLLALPLGGCLAALLGLLLFPLLRLSGAYFSIANLAAARAVYYVISNPDLTPLTQGPYGLTLSSVYNPNQSYQAMLVILLLALLATLFFRRSRLGLALLATREDPLSASFSGIPVGRLRGIAWLLSAFLAGLIGGAFAWHISVFYPQTVFDLSISVFAIVFVLFGGAATLLGPIAGTLLLYGLYNLLGISTPQYFELAYGLLIVLMVLFLPDGLVSLLTRRGLRVL